MKGTFVAVGFMVVLIAMRGAGYIYEVQQGFLTQGAALESFGAFVCRSALIGVLVWAAGRLGKSLRLMGSRGGIES